MKNYSQKYDLFFIHIPKNAGTSINEVLEIDPKHRGHRTAMELKKLTGENFEKSNKFCIIRNPWDRMVSLYKFRKRKGHDKHLKGDYTFDEWLFHPTTNSMSGHMEWTEQYKNIYYNNEWLVKYIYKDDYRSYYDEKSKDYVAKLFINDIEVFNYEF